jgi:hypothetical protein
MLSRDDTYRLDRLYGDRTVSLQVRAAALFHIIAARIGRPLNPNAVPGEMDARSTKQPP